jgi:hypothetical protein
MKWMPPIVLLLFALPAMGQPSDFMVLKKRNNKTVKTYFQGSPIQFVTTSGGSYNAVIDNINNDSLFVSEYIIVQMPTRLGVYVLDTAARYRYRFHYNEIRSIQYEKKGFNYRNSGASLMGGSILLLLGSGVAYVMDKDNFSPELLGAAVGLGIVGYFLTRLQTNNFAIGKKYKLLYMSVQPTK